MTKSDFNNAASTATNHVNDLARRISKGRKLPMPLAYAAVAGMAFLMVPWSAYILADELYKARKQIFNKRAGLTRPSQKHSTVPRSKPVGAD